MLCASKHTCLRLVRQHGGLRKFVSRRQTLPSPSIHWHSARCFGSETERGDGHSDSDGDWVITKTGLQYRDIVVGTGKTPTLSELVYVHYTGTLEDGTVFDSSYSHGRPIKFLVGRGKVIEGWDEGIMSMRVSGVRELVVPPELGYGPMGHGDIPGNAWLHFKCELVSMNTEPSPWTNLRSLMSNTYRVYTGGGLGKK